MLRTFRTFHVRTFFVAPLSWCNDFSPDPLVLSLHVGELVLPESGGEDGVDGDEDDHDRQAGERGHPEVPVEKVEGEPDGEGARPIGQYIRHLLDCCDCGPLNTI